MSEKIFSIKVQSPVRLDELLREKLPETIGKEISNSKIRRLIVAGAVNVNGLQCRIPGYNLKTKSEIQVKLNEERLFFEKQPDDINFDVTEKDVLFEDDNIIVVNKPSFFPTEAGMVGSRDNLHAAVVRYLHGKNPALRNPPYAGIMHRLDRETSGVILFTKTRTANGPCHDMFEKHTARKTYHAVVCANDNIQKSFTVEMLMGRISAKSQAAKWGRLPESKGGVSSKTDFKVLKEIVLGGKRYLYVEAKPLTGRTHQIRVHLASAGMPILGDELYGGKPYKRIMLHAYSLSFPHPVSNETMTVTTDFSDAKEN